jgi:isopentenyl-diphosphate delta-isomerase type 1
VVDEQDRPVGQAPRWRVHQEGLRHRAVHVLLFDERGRLYLQRRSQAKDSHPGKWTSSASGHLDPSEDYLPAALRELAEELGLRPEPGRALEYLGKIRAQPATENEFAAVYRLVGDQEPRPDPVEISEGRFFTPAQALELAQDPARGVPSLPLVLALAGLTG